MTRPLVERFACLGYDAATCAALEVEIAEVRELKRDRRAVVLAHSYQRPELFEIADFVGDSLELAREASWIKDRADVIVFCGVHFMAEMAKILSPERRVLLPNLAAGCSLADFATAEAVTARAAELRREIPDLAVVSYVNTTAAVKAVSDVCVTSANAARVVERLPNSAVLFLPDRNLAAWVAKQTKKRVISWDGDCCVHAELWPAEVLSLKEAHPAARVLAHPECRAEVLALADEALSTSGMMRAVRESKTEEFILVTERGVADKLTIEYPDRRFYSPCGYCKYMKLITLPDTRACLENLSPEITVPVELMEKARAALTRMLELSA